MDISSSDDHADLTHGRQSRLDLQVIDLRHFYSPFLLFEQTGADALTVS
jgi:hypothetical protein